MGMEKQTAYVYLDYLNIQGPRLLARILKMGVTIGDYEVFSRETKTTQIATINMYGCETWNKTKCSYTMSWE